MRSAELFDVLDVRVVRESRKGIGRGVFQPRAAKQPDELLTGKGHGNHHLQILAPAFLHPERALSTGTRCLGESFPAARRPLDLGPTPGCQTVATIDDVCRPRTIRSASVPADADQRRETTQGNKQ
jgi:hypothetical protein